MEARRIAVNAPELYYMYPTNGGLSAAGAKAAIAAGLPIPNLMPDCHVGYGGGVECAEGDFAAMPDFPQSAINCETNGGTSAMLRAVAEAADLQDWFNVRDPTLSRLRARTASFCSGASLQFDAFDQMISMFLPNMTWLQPPGFVHKMITDAWLPNALNVSISGGGNGYPAASAQLSNDGKSAVVQVVNPVWSVAGTNVTIAFTGFTPATSGGSAWTLASPTGSKEDANTPFQPTFISPVQTPVQWPAGAASATFPIPAGSFTLFQFVSA
jgi:hypothetical protein